MTRVLLDVPADQLVVTADQPDPRPVADALVERRGLLDVGEQDRHLAARRQPRQVRSFHLRPVGEILDRRPDGRAQPVLAQDVGGLPDLLDGLPATREQHVSGVDPARAAPRVRAVDLCSLRQITTSATASTMAIPASTYAAICAPITAQVLDAEPVMPEAPYYESRYIRANHPDRAQALWLRETLLLPTAGDPVAEVWVMIFDPEGEGNRAFKQPYPIDAAAYQYDTWTARIGATSHRRPVRAGRRHRRHEFDRRLSRRRSARWDLRITPGPEEAVKLLTDRAYKARIPTAKTTVRHPLAQFDGQVTLDDARLVARRLEGQRQPQLGHAAHPVLRVRPGVRLRRRARLQPGDRDRARRDRTGLCCPRPRCSCSDTPGRSSRFVRSLAACRPMAGTSRSHGRSGHASGPDDRG